jgi:hypothetical protein
LSISTNATETIMELKPSLRNEKPMTSGELWNGTFCTNTKKYLQKIQAWQVTNIG